MPRPRNGSITNSFASLREIFLCLLCNSVSGYFCGGVLGAQSLLRSSETAMGVGKRFTTRYEETRKVRMVAR